MTGIELIAQERERQIKKERFGKRHDAQHVNEELALAACYYALPGLCAGRANGLLIEIKPSFFFPETWAVKWAKRDEKNRMRQLVVAGALIAAEIDRLEALESTNANL